MEATKMSISRWMDKKAVVHIHHGILVQFSRSVMSNSLWPPWTKARQASLSITNSRSPPKPISMESVMPSRHLILCHPLLLLPSVFPSTMECYSAIKKNAFESVLMRRMKLEPIIQSEVSQKEKQQYSTLTHIHMEFRKMVTMTLYTRQQKRHRCKEETFGLCGRRRGWGDLRE